MRPADLAHPLALLTLLACEPGDDPSARDDPVSPLPAPSLGATVDRLPFNFFFLQDFDRDISATIGLVSPPEDLGSEPDCGGSGPEVYDGGGLEQIVSTPSGSFHIRDGVQQGTFVLYEGATSDPCELPSHPVIARGKVNFHFAIKGFANGRLTLQVTLNGIVKLTEGGFAHHISTANFGFDSEGNLFIHVDKFELQPIGRT